MGRQIIKVSREDDLYVEWSSVVETATFVGDRQGTREYLNEAVRGEIWPRPEAIEAWLIRADETGSSALLPLGYTWDSPGPIYRQQGVLPRPALPEFARRLLASPDDVEPDVADLLVPFEREA
jgi:hypothetical protein